MKKIITFLLILMVFVPNLIFADMLGNPGEQIGKKNLFVGVEYSSNMHIYDLDTTKGLETSSERISLKVTAGLNDWLDIFVKAGGASLMLDYKKEGNAIKNFDSSMSAGFGAGTRIRLLNFVDSGTRVFFQGGGFFFKADDDFILQNDVQTKRVEREIKWADLYAGLGIVKRMDFIDLNFGIGFSEIKWWINDVEIYKVGGIEQKRITKPERDSFETKTPVFGFIGLDFILPYKYRISAQAGIRNLEEAEFSIALSQGLEHY